MSDSSGFNNGITRRQWLGRTAGVAAAAGMGSLLGGLPIGAARAQGQPKRGGTLRVATVDKPVNMDPGFAQLYSSLQVYQNVFNKLVYVDETGQFIPGLAKSWKQENDKTWLFDKWSLGVYVDIQNLYNATNPELITNDYRYRTQGFVAGLPFLPILGLKGNY